MADLNVAIALSGKDEGASGVVNSVRSALGGLGESVHAPTQAMGGLLGAVTGVASGFALFGLAAQGVMAGVNLVAGGITGLIGDAQQAQAVQAQLNSVLVSTQGAAGMTAASVNALADKFSMLTPFEDEAIISAESMLLTFTNIGKDVFPRATETVLNMSQALGQDLQSSSIQLGKALNDPINGVTALQRVGVTFNQTQKDTIKTMIDSGNVAGAQGIILKELETEFGGAAQAAGQTFGGQLKILDTILGNVKEAIFTPVLGAFTGGLKIASEALQSEGFQSALPKIGEFLADLAQRGITLAAQGFSTLISIISNVVDTLSSLFDALGKGDFAGAVAIIQTSIGNVFGNILDSIDSFAKGMFGAGYNLIAALADGVIKGGVSVITDAVNFVAGIIADFLIGFSDTNEGPLSHLTEGGYNDIAALATGVKAAAPLVQSAVKEVTDNFQSLFEANKVSVDAVRDSFTRATGNLSQMKEVAGDVEGAIKGIESQTRALDFESSKLKFTVDSIKSAYDEMVAPLQQTLDQIKNFRDFSSDAKKIEFERENLAIRSAEIGARGNKDAEAAIKKRRDEFSVRKDTWDIQQQQLDLDRKMAALPLEKQIHDIRNEQNLTLKPMQDQLRIMDEQGKSLAFQRKEWGLVKSEIDAAVKAATPKGGGGGGGAGAGSSIPKPTGGGVLSALPTKKDIQDGATKIAEGIGDSIGSKITTGVTSYLGKNLATTIATGIGAIVGAGVFGPVGLAAGAALGNSFGQALTTKFAEHGRDLNLAVQQIFERVTTFASSLGNMESLGTAVNKAFGDMIPASLNTTLDSVNSAFLTVKATASDLVATFQQGGFVGIWQAVTAAMSDFAPTGERLQSVIKVIGEGIRLLVPQPLQDLVTGIIGLGVAATGSTSVTGLLRDVVKTLADVLNLVTGIIADEIQSFKTHTAATSLLVGIIGGLTAAYLLYQGTLLATSLATAGMNVALNAVGLATKAYTVLQIALNFALTANPIGIVVVALAGLAAGLLYAYNNSDDFRKIVDDTFTTLKEVVTVAIATAKTAIETFQNVITRTVDVLTNFSNISKATFTAINTAIVSAMGTIGSSINTGWNTITNTFTTSLSTITGGVTSSFDTIRNAINTKQEQIKKIIMDIWNALPEDIKADLTLIYNTISTRFQDKYNKISTTMSDIKKFINDTWNSISSSVSSLLTTIAGVIAAKWAAMQLTVSTIMGLIDKLINDGWNTIKGAVETTVELIRGVVEAKWNLIQTTVEAVMTAVSLVVTTTWEAVRAVVEEKINAAMVIVTGWKKDLEELLGKLKDTVILLATNIGSNIVDGIKSGLDAGWSALKDWAMQLVRDLLAAMKTVIRPGSPSKASRDEVGIPLMQGIGQGLTVELPNVIQTAQMATQTIMAAFTGGAGAPGGGVPWFAGIGAQIGNGIFGSISKAVKNNTQDVINGIETMKNEVSDTLNGLNGWLQGWIDKVVAHRTELLRIFNYAAFLRGEGTKVLPELKSITENFIRDTTAAAVDAGNKLQNLARTLQDDIATARKDATAAADQVVAAAAGQIRQLALNASLQKEIKMQRDAFATMMADEKAHFDASQQLLQTALKRREDIARINFSANAKLGQVGVDQAPGVTTAQAALDTQTEILRIRFEAERDSSRVAAAVGIDNAKKRLDLETTLSEALTEVDRVRIQAQIDAINAGYGKEVAAKQADIAKQAADALVALNDRLAEEKYLADATRDLRLTLQRQTIMAERDAALKALKDQQAEEIAVANETSALRQEIADRERTFNEVVRFQQESFEKSMDDAAMQRQINNIYAERDARIEAIGVALAEKENQLNEAMQKERIIILDSLAQQLEDYKKKYLDEVVAAFHHAQVDIGDFLKDIDDLAKNVGRTLNNEVLNILKQIEDMKQTVGNTPGFIPQPAPAPIPNPTFPFQNLPPSSIIGALPNEPRRQLTINNYITTTVPVTAAAINTEISRSILLAG